MTKTWFRRSEYWLILSAVVVVLVFSGFERFHVRAFGSFVLVLLALVTGMLALVVRAYRPGDAVTRESFEDSALPHQSWGGDEE